MRQASAERVSPQISGFCRNATAMPFLIGLLLPALPSVRPEAPFLLPLRRRTGDDGDRLGVVALADQ